MSLLLADYVEFIGRLEKISENFFTPTEQESIIVSRAEAVITQLNNRFSVVGKDGKKTYVLPENYHELLAEELRRKRLSLKKVSDTLNQIFSRKWYTLTPIEKNIYDDDIVIRLAFSSDKTKGEKVVLEDDCELYNFYSTLEAYTPEYMTDKEIEDYGTELALTERKILNLTPDYKFIRIQDFYFIRVCKEALSYGKGKRAIVYDDWKIKSAPMLILPVKMGRKSVNNAIAGTMIERGRSILSAGNQKVSYTPNKAANTFLKGNVNAQKLFDLIQHEAFLTGYKTTRLKIAMSDILEMRGLKDMKELKKQITAAAALLDDMNFTGQLGGGDFDKIAITQGDTSIAQGYLFVNLNEKFLEGLRDTEQIALYNPELQKLPSIGFSYGFARLFQDHKRRNAGQPNENRLSVAKLLESAPYPLFDELPNKGHAGQKIIDPFIKCFDRIEEQGIFSYRFCKSGGEPLTDAEIDRLYTDYSLFASLLVEVKYFKEPDYEHLIDLKAKAASTAAKAKAPEKGKRKERFRLQKN